MEKQITASVWRRIAFIGLCLTLLLSISACNSGQSPKKLGDETSKIPQDKPTYIGEEQQEGNSVENPVEYDDSFLTESISQDGTYLDPEDYPFEYSYHVPQLCGDSPGIRDANAKIHEFMGTRAESALARISEGEYPDIDEIKWQSYWQDSLVCLTMTAGFSYAMNEYTILNFDFALDRVLTSGEMLDRIGVPPEEFGPAAERAVLQYFDSKYSDLSLEYASMYYGEILSLRADTLDKVVKQSASLYSETSEPMDPDSPMLYLEQGVCKMVATIYSPAGEGWYHTVVDLDFSAHISPSKTVTKDFITARLENNNRLSLSFRNVDLYCGGYITSVVDLRPNEAYEVAGLRGGYRDLLIGTLGTSYDYYLFLLREDGSLEFVNINECAHYGFFCVMPVPGLRKIQSLYPEDSPQESDDNSCTVYAVNRSGTQYDLLDWASLAWRGPSEADWVTTETGGDGYHLFFSEDGIFQYDKFVPDSDPIHQDGEIHCLGMDGEGLIYGYSLYGNNDASFQGGALLLQLNQNAGGNRELYVTTRTGSPLFDTSLGSRTKLVQSYG